MMWDGQGTTTAGTTYQNTYAWFMTLSGGKVIDGTAFYDSIAFKELWDSVTSQPEASPSKSQPGNMTCCGTG